MFCEGDLRKYVELAEEALKLRSENPLRAIDGLVRVHELMEEYMHEYWEGIMTAEEWDQEEDAILMKDYNYFFSAREAIMSNEWYKPVENRINRGVKVADIRRYLDDWHVFFIQKINASMSGKPEPNTLDDPLTYEQRVKIVDGEGENEKEIEREHLDISTADMLAFDLYETIVGDERYELVDEAYVRGFINKKQKEKMYYYSTHQVNKGREIIINNSMGGLIRYDSDETREEYARRMNNSLREYNKIARVVLERRIPKEIEGLIEEIEKGEFMLHFDKRIIKEFDYTRINDKGVERKYRGSWDYETYREMFENPDCRKQIEEILNKEPYNKQDTLIEEYEIQCFHSALKTELSRAKKLEKIRINAQNNAFRPGESTHFSKRVSDDELSAIFNGLMEHKMLCDNPSLADFIYWHTGSGTPPAQPLMWAAKNVCRYYVQQYHNSGWSTAECCFSCKRGSISGLSQATNITDRNKKIIDSILDNAKKKQDIKHD